VKLFRSLFVLIAAMGLMFGLSSCSNNNASLSDAQKAQVDQQIHDYLLANPDILNQMVQKLQAQQMQQQQAQARGAIKQNAAQIVNDPNSPVAGDANGTVTVVEFFDYQCVHCAHMYPIVKQVMAANPNVRFVFKEFPIFGGPSQYAATAALAAVKQGKYLQMHNALFDSGDIEGKMTNAKVDAIARKAGLNVMELKRAMKADAVGNELKSTFMLAQQLGIQGTPAFIIVPTNLGATTPDAQIGFIPGGTDVNGLQQAINAAK